MAKRLNTEAISRDYARRRGWHIGVVSSHRIIKGKGVLKQDLWGFGDLIMVVPGSGQVTIIQSTSHGNRSSRLKKILQECTLDAVRWLKEGQAIEVWGWKPLNKSRRRTASRIKVQLDSKGQLCSVEMAELE